MRVPHNDRVWLRAEWLLPLLLFSCTKAPPPNAPEASSDGLLVANAEPVRTIPRRLNPIIITNITAPAPAPAASLIPPTPPTVVCGPAQNISCASADGVQLTLTAHVEDANGDALSVVWSADGRERFTQQVTAAGPPTVADLSYTYTFTPGDHGVNITVSDGMLTSTCDTTVTVQKDNQEPMIVCPADLSVFTDPGRCAAIVTFAPSATDNCPDIAVVCEPPSGSAFPIGVTTVNCTATDGAGNVAACAFAVAVQVANRAPLSDAYWRQNPGAWTVHSMTLGSQVYSRAQLQVLLRSNNSTDPSMVLARQLIATTLNTAAHSDPRPICGVVGQANSLLSGFSGKLPYRVNVTSPMARSMLELATVLNGYNNGMVNITGIPIR